MKTHEVVISGMAGSFPECLNTKQLETAAFLNQSLVTDDDRKWTRKDSFSVPSAVGKIKDCFKFDQMFFGIHRRLCTVMDVHAKHSIERTYEALCDAGVNPQDLNGEKIAVVMSSMTSETEYGSCIVLKTTGHAMLGHSRCMQANRISYFFNFTGPSFSLDSSWVGPIQALVIAHDLVANGHVKAAVVGASNIVVRPEVSCLYDGLRKLNHDGKTKSYSADADGYSRSDGIVVFVLQRATDALRSYGSIVKVACRTQMNNKGVFSDQIGFTQFLKEFYSNIPSHIKNSDIAYIEGDGSASLATDAMELNGLAEVLCSGRKKPLLVGSCKSLLGHAEASAAFMSLVNALMAMKTGYISPVLHFSSNNPLVPALRDGRMKIVTEKMKLEGDYVGVSSYGLSSIFSHVLLKKNPNSIGIRDESHFPPDGVPRLFLLSGRNEHNMLKVLQKIEKEPVNESYYALNHQIFKSTVPMHLYRGISIVGEEKSLSEVNPFKSGIIRPVWFIFSGMGSQWLGMGTGIMKIPAIRRSIQNSHKILLSKGVDLIEIITSRDPKTYDNILHSFIGIAAIQIALVDLLEEIGITPDGIVGHSVGELGCSYADKCLTAEQVILAAYARGKASNDAVLIKGMMAAVGKGYKDIKDELPDGIEVACHNSNVSCTLSGPAELMETYVNELTSKGVFAKLVNVANIAYHSKNIAPAAPYLKKYLKEIIPQPKPRSSKWISSSVPENKWDTDLAKYCSAEYHTNNLLSYVLFEEASAHIPDNAICIEIAPHGLLQAIVKRSLKSCIHVPLTSRFHKEGCLFLIHALGKLFLNCVEINLTKLYPPVEYPVPRETDYLQHIITWDHNEEWIPLSLQRDFTFRHPNSCWGEEYLFGEQAEQASTPLENYVIHGTAYCPQISLMNILMRSIVDKLEDKSSIRGYHFEDVQFLSNLTYDEALKSPVQSLHQKGSGKFEIMIFTKILLVGILNPMPDPLPPTSLPSEWSVYKGQKIVISENDIYDYFSANDCIFRGPYRNISSITFTEQGFNSKIKWTGDPELFLDGIFRSIIYYWSIQKDALVDIKSINQFMFDPSSLPENNAEIDIYYDNHIGHLAGEGVRMANIKTKPMKDYYSSALEVKDRYFSPYVNINSDVDIVELCLQLIRENNEGDLLDVQVVIDESSNICKEMLNSFLSKPLQKLMFNLRIRNSKYTTFIPEAVSAKKFNGCYLIISEYNTPEVIKILLDSDIPFYVLHSGDLPKEIVNNLTEIYVQFYKGCKLVLYKKKMRSISIYNYVVLKDNYLNDLKKMDPLSNIITVYIYKYKMMSEIINFLMSISINYKNMRFVFINESSPNFNPSHKFYEEQLVKDLMINIVSEGKWGSLREKPIPTNSVINFENVKYSEMPFNCIRSAKVDIKVVGLNLKNVVSPSLDTKFGVIDYCGTIGKDEVFGIGKLSEDNYLEVDKTLCWKKPKHWSNEQAATVPLFYAMAYQILVWKSKDSHRSCETLLIHCGHTPFSQAVIHVALSMNIKVFTTCYSKSQKEIIINNFPQIAKQNVLIIEKGFPNYDMLYHIMKITNGEGVKLSVDGVEDFSMRNISIDCVGPVGRYCYIGHNDVDTLHTFGMGTFMNEKCVMGFNPDLIFDLKDDNKQLLAEEIQLGIINHTIKPLESYTIQDVCSRKQATDTIIEYSNSSQPPKVLMIVNEKQSYKTNTKELAGKKNYLIVGSYNSIWIDITKWLISRGADSINIVFNQKDIPQNSKKWFNNFMENQNKSIIKFIETENLNTTKSCNDFIRKLISKHSIDVLFYIKPGFEKQMKNIDLALRNYSKSTYLVLIGVEGCEITEKWKQDGYKGITFTLMKNDLKNNMLVSVLDNWLTKWDEVEGFVIVDKLKYADGAMNKNSDILPVNAGELIDLHSAADKEPSFKEISTRCPPSHFNSDTNPVIIFPGLKMAKTEEFVKKLIYPTYVAKYPLMIKSMNELASQFSKLLIKNFNQNMFTLIAEGWSGPLVISIVKLLEDKGKISEIILLDASPSSIVQWPSHIMNPKSVISKYMPSMRMNEKLTTDGLKSFCNHVSKSMAREFHEYTQEEIGLGLKILFNRLELINDFSLNNIKIKSIIHLFTPENTDYDITELNQICLTQPCKHHIMKDDDCKSLLQCSQLINDVCNLALLEYKNCARKQDVGVIGTIDFIFDNNFNTEGLTRF